MFEVIEKKNSAYKGIQLIENWDTAISIVKLLCSKGQSSVTIHVSPNDTSKVHHLTWEEHDGYARNRSQRMNMGDYLVTSTDGQYVILSRSEFESKFDRGSIGGVK